MKVLHLPNNFFNIQKCLLPDCQFINKNLGQHCVVTSTSGRYIVRLSLCQTKNITSVFFLDESVSLLTPDNINQVNSTNVGFDQFTLLPKPVIAETVSVTLVFNDSFSTKYKNINSSDLNKIVKDILKLFVVCKNSFVSLKNLTEKTNFGINCIIVENINGNFKNNQTFKIDSQTKIHIEKCTSKLQYEQKFKKCNRIEIGGCERIYKILRETIELSKFVKNQKLKLINKLLLVGPSGCGKTLLVEKLANDCNCVLLKISPTDVNSLTPNDVKKTLTDVFNQAREYSETDCCIILIEDINLMSYGKSIHSKSFVRQLIYLLEEIENAYGIYVIATTNCPDEVDRQLRMPKRFEDEIEAFIPNAEEREDILRCISKNSQINCSADLIHQLSKWTAGFVGADLKLLVLEALLILQKKQGLNSAVDDNLLKECFKLALTKVTPSGLKGTLELCKYKDTSFSQIGGLEDVKRTLDLLVRQQLENPEKFHKLGVPLTKGILLYGPPGCAKTSLVKALAKECHITFFITSAADLYSPYVGDAEKKLEQLFSQARVGSPSILFIDEIDAVVGSKSGRERGVQERILSTLLIEMDGVGLKANTQKNSSMNLFEHNQFTPMKHKTESSVSNGVIVIGATNQPQLLDDALKRPGRFDRLLYVPPPNEAERLRILQKITEKMPLHESVDLHLLAKLTEFYSGADLKNLCQESGLFALETSNMSANYIHWNHFEKVLKNLKPSLNEKIIAFYESFKNCTI